MLLQHALEEAAGLRAEAALQGDRLLHEDRAPPGQQRQRGRDLGGDVGAADQHPVLAVLGVGADRVGVAQRAEVVDPVQLAAVDLQPAHVGAGGDQGVS